MKTSKFISPKIISDPLYGIIDVRSVLPMIETKEFQALGYKYQLGLAYLIFPSATHSRKTHSLGAYASTVDLTNHWLQLEIINKEEAKALCGFALYHDIGHPAFSHVTEPLCPRDNDEQGMAMIGALRKQIEQCGINFELFKKIFDRKNPLYLAVHDKNLGMEKLDYLERDGLMTILSRPNGVDYLRKHIYFIDGKLVIDEKGVDHAKDVQDFYVKMFKNVYLRKASAIGQRMMQKMVHLLIQDGSMNAEDLYNMTDFQLLAKLEASDNGVVNYMYNNLMERNLFREAVVVKPQAFVHAVVRHGKPIFVYGADEKEMDKITNSDVFQVSSFEKLSVLEEKISLVAGIPKDTVLVVPMFSPERFRSKDIYIYTSQGKIVSMKKLYPGHFQDMQETAKAYSALRICTTEKYREKLSSRPISRKVIDLLLS